MIFNALGVRKSFGDNEVLRGIDIGLDKGDVVAIIGPSGSGKTTLLRCLNFLEKADSGHIVFDGKKYELGHMSRRDVMDIRRETGFVFQNYNLFANKSALGNITEGLVIARHMPRKDAEALAFEALRKVGLEDRARYYPQELSGGQQQRVAIARAIVANPKIIYFDEPTSALDPELTSDVLNTIKGLASEGRTMLVVTHEMAFARSIASRIVFIENGLVVEEGRSEEFFSHPKEQRTEDFLKKLDSYDN